MRLAQPGDDDGECLGHSSPLGIWLAMSLMAIINIRRGLALDTKIDQK